MSPLVEFLQGFDHWHWWVAGIVLVILEVFAPGAVFLWLGVAAGVVGILVLAAPDLAWQYQFVIFSVLSVLSVVLSRRYLKRRPIATDRPQLNRRAHQYIDRIFTIGEPIENGRGRLHVDDTMWKISGPDLAAGSKVRVADVDGVVLQVVAEAKSGEAEPV